MTKDEILAMEAGKELDSLVATKVMNWIEKHWESPFGLSKRDSWVDPATGVTLRRVSAWRPSTDLPTAWWVVEEMSELGYNMSLLHLSTELWPDYWYCDFRPKSKREPPKYEWVDHQETAQLAICKAALLTRLKGEVTYENQSRKRQ